MIGWETIFHQVIVFDILRVINRLVHPVPDTTTDTIIAILDNVPIVLQVAHSITHGMSIFAQEERFGADTVATVCTCIVQVGIHLRIKVCICWRVVVGVTFVMDRSAVQTLYRFVGSIKVDADT